MPTTDTIIVDTINYLQILNRSVSTTPPVTAPPADRYPAAIDTANGPFAMTWPGQGEAWQKGHGYNQAIMTYRVLVYIEPLNQDDVPARTVDGATLLQQFINLYVNANNTPQATPPPYQLTIQSGPDGSHISHGGLVPTLRYRGVSFVGFEIAVPVRCEWIL